MLVKLTILLLLTIVTANTEIALSAPTFTSDDLSIPSDGGGGIGVCHLGATFLKPTETPARALVLFIHGSGTNDRNEQMPSGHHPFKDIAESLSQNGFATLRFDKRGIQQECRPPTVNNPQLTPWMFVQDVQNIITYAQNDSRMNTLPLVLLGHSEGVNFATELALQGIRNLKAVVLIAGLGRYAIDETLVRQYRQLLEMPNLPLASQLQVQTLLTDGLTFFGKIADGSIQSMDSYMSIYSRYWMDWISITKNGADSARHLKVPAFVIRGTADTNVTAEDFEALKLATQNVPGSRALAPLNLDHTLAEPGTTVVSPMVLDPLSLWLKNLP